MSQATINKLNYSQNYEGLFLLIKNWTSSPVIPAPIVPEATFLCLVKLNKPPRTTNKADMLFKGLFFILQYSALFFTHPNFIFQVKSIWPFGMVCCVSYSNSCSGHNELVVYSLSRFNPGLLPH